MGAQELRNVTVREYSRMPAGWRSNRDGFSLVELVVVVGILGVLAVIAVPIIVGLHGAAADNAVRAAAGNGATAAIAAAAGERDEASMTTAAQSAAEANISIVLAGTSASTVCVSAYALNSPSYPDEAAAFRAGPGCS